MRALYLAPFAFAVGLVVSNAQAAETPRDIKGLYLMTDYPAVTVRPGTTSNIPLRLQNYGLDPQRYQLSVTGVPSGWTATLLGGGQPVAAAMPAPDASVPLQLRLDVPANAELSAQTLTVKAEGQGSEADAAAQRRAGQGAAGQVDRDFEAAVTARQPEVELRIYAHHQERPPDAIWLQASPPTRRPISRPRSPRPMAPRNSPRSRSRPASPRTSSSRSVRPARSMPGISR